MSSSKIITVKVTKQNDGHSHWYDKHLGKTFEVYEPDGTLPDDYLTTDGRLIERRNCEIIPDTHPQGEKPKTDEEIIRKKINNLSDLHLFKVSHIKQILLSVMSEARASERAEIIEKGKEEIPNKLNDLLGHIATGGIENGNHLSDRLKELFSHVLAAKEQSHKAAISDAQNAFIESQAKVSDLESELQAKDKQMKEFAEWASDNDWKFYKTTWSPAKKDIWIKDGEQKTTSELFALFLSQGKKGSVQKENNPVQKD